MISSMAAKRSYGTGSLYEKSGAYYGRWRTPDGRLLNVTAGADGAVHTTSEPAPDACAYRAAG